MKAVYIQNGEILDYKNMTGEEIPENAIVLMGNRMGVTGGKIPAGEIGSLQVTGVFEMPKKTGVALAAGDDVVFTSEDGIDKATDIVMGYAVQEAKSGERTVQVKLLG